MAKHVKNSFQSSKGQRRSSIKAGGKKASAIINQAERAGTAMREAFLSAKINPAHTAHAAIVNDILTSAKRNAGNNVVGRGWSANLSPRTVRQLTEQGVFG